MVKLLAGFILMILLVAVWPVTLFLLVLTVVFGIVSFYPAVITSVVMFFTSLFGLVKVYDTFFKRSI